jgi:recombination protein RecT
MATAVMKPQGPAEGSGQETALSKPAERPVARQMEILLPKVEDLLPPDIRFDQFRAAIYLELSGRPQLAQCVPESLRDSVLYAANYGLLPGRDCHFLPFRQQRYGNKLGAICVANYFGIILTMERSGKIRRAFAHPVYEYDEWDFNLFTDRPTHRPAITLGKKPGKELFYYGAVMFKDGTCAFEVLTLDELKAIRNSAPAHDSGPWATHTVMMNRKSAIKRVAKFVRLTPQLRQLIQEDDLRELEDIPPERQRKNLTDMFGDGDPAQTFEETVRGTPPKRDPVKPPTAGTKDPTGSPPPAAAKPEPVPEGVDPETGELFNHEKSAARDWELMEDAE